MLQIKQKHAAIFQGSLYVGLFVLHKQTKLDLMGVMPLTMAMTLSAPSSSLLMHCSATGPTVRMVLEIIKDMRYFLLVLACMVLGFGSAFHLLFSTTGTELTPAAWAAFSDVPRTLVTMLAAMVGSYDQNVYYEANMAWLAVTLLVVYVVLMVVVLLNLLINIMGGSYERVSRGVCTRG